jgi:uncharacterized protein YggE
MRQFTAGTMLATVLALVWLPAVAQAQRRGGFGESVGMDASAGVVSGHGTVVVKRPPTLARMVMTLSGKGKTVEDALADLKAKREKAVALLEKLGADKKSIEPGPPTVSRDDSRKRHELESMIRQKMRGGKGGKAIKLPESVTLVATLSAEWPLAAADADATFATVHKLQEQIKAAKLSGGKEPGKLSPEEEELAEEMGGEAEQMFPRYGDEQGDPSAPVFMYVAAIGDEDRDKAMAEAFQKAKADAARLAQAAGVELGALVGVSGAGNTGPMNSGGVYEDLGSGPMRELLMRSMQSGGTEEKEQEATGSDPGHVSFMFTVMANFALKKAGEKPKAAAEK